EVCEAANVAAIGAGATLAEARRPARFEVNGRRVVFLAYGAASGNAATHQRPGIAPLETDLVLEDLREWRSRCDVLVISAHWGSMYVDYPPPRVVDLARTLAEYGADLV